MNNRIRKVTAVTGIITTIAGTGTTTYTGDSGLATSATLYYPSGVAIDSSGSTINYKVFCALCDPILDYRKLTLSCLI